MNAKSERIDANSHLEKETYGKITELSSTKTPVV